MRREPIARVGTIWYLLLLLLFPVLLWPAAINGGPILFADSTAYIRGPDAIVARLTGQTSAWTRHVPRTVPTVISPAMSASGPAASSPEPGHPAAVERPILLGRSIYYGAFAYLGVLTTDWLTLALQALVAWGCSLGLLRHVVDPADRRRFAGASVLTMAMLAISPLPFFASFLMPDVLTGCAMIAAAALLAGWDRERWPARIAWSAVATFAALSHASHILILLGLAAGTVALAVMARTWPRQGRPGSPLFGGAAAMLGLAALLGLVGDATFTEAVERATGHEPIRPPFVTARLVADGLAGPFLQRHCGSGGGEPPYALCRYSGRMPAKPMRAWSDGFLWSKDGNAGGVFMAVPASQQRALASEQGRFALHVFLERPVSVTLNALTAAAEQAMMMRLDEFNYSPDDRSAMPARLPASVLQEVRKSAAYHGTMPTRELQLAGWLVGGIALVLTALAIRSGRATGMGRYAAVMAAAWLANAVICGALSTPHDRYNTRALWPLFVLGAGAAASLYPNRRRAEPA